MERKIPRILFAISDTGGGHRSAATAIKAAIEQLAQGSVECYIVDILTSTGLPIARSAPEVYDNLRNRWLPVFDLGFRLTDGRRRVDMLTWMLYFSAHRNILRVLEEIQPTMVVSVHPLTNRFIANTRRVYRLSFHFVTVVTDLVSLHASWADPQAELTIVPTEEAYDRQIKFGLSPEKMLRTGFPVHPKFTVYNSTRQEARTRLELALDPFTVLVTSGGVDSSQAHELIRRLAEEYPAQQFLVVTGKNADLKAELEQLALGPHVRIYGFVNNMEELMGASDLVITKAGPGTLMEALVLGRPVIVTEAIGMQERGNIDFVLNHELGVFCPTIDRIVPTVADLMNPETYAATVARLADAVPRDGATVIAHLLVDRLKLAPPVRERRLRLPSVADLRRLGTQFRLTSVHRRPHLPHLPHPSTKLFQARRLSRWRNRASRQSEDRP
ncbi:MAG: glycosyltransferase [Roseiflexaceae bacterium]|nr:glycosyltransferase [Roseiflexaceae bacterium]